MGKKKQKHQSKAEILKEKATESNRLSPTRQATLQIGEKEIVNTPLLTDGETNQTDPHPKSASSEHDINDHFKDGEPTSKGTKTLKAQQKSGSKLEKGKKRKDKETKASKHGDDDNEKDESRREEKDRHDEILQEHAAQVTTKSENPSSKSPRKEQKDGDLEGRTPGSKVPGTRVFTEEDDIVLLQGTINCALSHNVPPSSINAGVLREFLYGKLHSDFSKTQIYEKIRRLKQKFVRNMKMFESSGVEGPVFSKTHDAMAFELSKKIWGGEIGSDSNPNVSDNHASGQTLVKDSGGLDAKGNKKRNKGKKSLAGVFGATEAAAALDALKDGEGHYNNGGTGVQNGHDEEDEDWKVSMKKKRLLVGIENFTKKIKLMLELAKLEFDELKNE